MSHPKICILSFTAAALISSCDSSSSKDGNSSIKSMEGQHSIWLTPDTVQDANGQNCSILYGQVYISSVLNDESSPPFSAYFSPAVPLNVDSSPIGSLGGSHYIMAMMDRNGTLQQSLAISLGNWGVSKVDDLESLESFDLLEEFDSYDTDASSAQGFTADAATLAAAYLEEGLDPVENAEVEFSGNIFDGGKWSGPIGYQGAKCSGEWEILIHE